MRAKECVNLMDMWRGVQEGLHGEKEKGSRFEGLFFNPKIVRKRSMSCFVGYKCRWIFVVFLHRIFVLGDLFHNGRERHAYAERHHH